MNYRSASFADEGEHSVTIRCLGCDQTFDDAEEINRNRVNAGHPDVGEIYL